MAAFPAIAFEQPTTEERLKAIGPTDALPPALQRALTIEDFVPLLAPRQQDWLAVHPEPAQAFEEFRREQPNRPMHSGALFACSCWDTFQRKILLRLKCSFSTPLLFSKWNEDFVAPEYRARRLQPNEPHHIPATDSDP